MKTDSQIQADILQELKWDPRVTHEYISIAVSDAVFIPFENCKMPEKLRFQRTQSDQCRE